MAQLRNLCKVDGNSLLESVMALSIISICLYIAMMVYAAAFTPKTSLKFYSNNNKINEAFFLLQINNDTLTDKLNNDNWTVEEDVSGDFKKVTITYKDSIQTYHNRKFYIASE